MQNQEQSAKIVEFFINLPLIKELVEEQQDASENQERSDEKDKKDVKNEKDGGDEKDGKKEGDKKTKVEGGKENAKGGKDALLQHLLLIHSFVIADVHLIADFPQYIR